jgi:septal ring factor EnvC (AmiA/AmiB activator)
MKTLLRELGMVAIGGISAGIAWYWSHRKTKKEALKESLDLSIQSGKADAELDREKYDIISQSVEPLLNSIKLLTDRNSELAKQLVEAHERAMDYYNDIITLKGKIQELTQKVSELTREISLLKKEK